MDIGLVNSISSTSEVKSVKNTAYTQDNQQKVDYSNYSIADLRKIPYEEAKGNFDAIMNRASELSIDDKSGKESAGVIAQLESTRVSDNNTFNKIILYSNNNSLIKSNKKSITKINKDKSINKHKSYNSSNNLNIFLFFFFF